MAGPAIISRERRRSASLTPISGFGTKAEMLSRLRPLVSRSSILDLYVFNVREWLERPGEITETITSRFGGGPVVVRSSAVGEDGPTASMAGVYASRLGVNGADPEEVAAAVRAVVASYGGNPLDQVLVQPMLSGTEMSGVVMTHDLNDGSPYYIINYDDESGKTDSITGGIGVNKTVLVYRHADPSHLESERVVQVLRMTKELEEICGRVPLDIEFCLTRSGELHLLQVRQISVSQRWREQVASEVAERLPFIEAFVAERSLPRPGVVGRRTILGVMPDWNPAEIIGTTANTLATSLYRELITRSVWREARRQMGYRELPPEELMVVIAGRPFIDVRNSFNSFLPAGLDDGPATAVVNAWLDRLDGHPELHDKVEFEIAQTCLDFTFDDTFRDRYAGALSETDRRQFRDCLAALTARALNLGRDGTLSRAEAAVGVLAERQRERPRPADTGPAGPAALAEVVAFLDECKTLGTLPFSVLARHAFVAESMLRSAVQRGALAAERLTAFKRSVRTVSGEFAMALQAVAAGESAPEQFLSRFGHLRPGTYDIQSLTYANRQALFRDCMPAQASLAPAEFTLSQEERRSLDLLLREIGVDALDGSGLLEYARRAIAGREYAKFVFTRNLSDALERLARWGEGLALGREEIAHLELADILDTLAIPTLADDRRYFRERAERGRRRSVMARAIKLGHLIRDVRDVYVVPLHRSMPNFVGCGHVHGAVVRIDAAAPDDVPLVDKIVCVENADPGFDWIFGKGIRALITKYGGANSHMAIRCVEFGLPAAIGCGEQVFERIVAAGAVDLHCGEKTIRPVHEH